MDDIDPGLRRADFEYPLPSEAIAQSAIEPRDAARLLDTRDLSDHLFNELPGLLEPGDLVIVNETRVRRARLRGTRAGTGGAVELLVLEDRGDGTWTCLVRPARRLRPGVVIEIGELLATIVDAPADGQVGVRFGVTGGESVEAWFESTGDVPLPPYFHGALTDPSRYQTLFAEPVGSAAAPTAALHFTNEVVRGLERRGVEMARVELRVGIDTFRPMTESRLADHRMHSEWARVPPETAAAVARARRQGGRVVAIGTTVVRTLEAAAEPDGHVRAMEGHTDLFITPGYGFRVVDGIITNFHVPGSTLVALVAAALGDRWLISYETALARGYRFLSFGDAMFIETPGNRA